MVSGIPRTVAEQLDAADPLAAFRERFVIADPELIYLDGNSLGPLPAVTPEVLREVVEEGWGGGLVRSWQGWIDWGARLGDRLAEHVLGAAPGEVVISDSTSVNLYKLAAAALDAAPGRGTVVMDAEDFPTNRYIVQGLAEQRGLRLVRLPSDLDGGFDLDVLRSALDGDVALVVLSLVSYRSGALLDMAQVNDLARAVGARVLWDVSHAAGAVPVDLAGTGAELAVGCTYKYLNGGPGSPAFLYVRRDLQPRLRQPVWGWYGQRGQFEMGPDYDPVPGIERFLVSTPPLVSLAAIDPALALVEEAGTARIRAKGLRLGRLADELADDWLIPLGFRPASPRPPERRGSHLSLYHPDAWRICQALAADAKVICDYRVPDRLRIGLSPLVTRFTDVWDALARIRDVVSEGAYASRPADLARVT
ncbi:MULTISPECIES: kynureninase [unclassified Streptomyces]|uniref:kynureninase n=1 Tax=unclassified Streptomyces TaxID=2593676 RepID=UPI0004BD1D3B|nr:MULTISPECIES: aminotransferase class V-fold PLP-dependent enzyme [unclassified Streptomyces]KMS78282.1 kynureninase [Streptomyces regensis]MBG7696534.1 aminotransferase class V-fold PLP-dependent enzyme [Streptomyces sp. MC1]